MQPAINGGPSIGSRSEGFLHSKLPVKVDSIIQSYYVQYIPAQWVHYLVITTGSIGSTSQLTNCPVVDESGELRYDKKEADGSKGMNYSCCHIDL